MCFPAWRGVSPQVKGLRDGDRSLIPVPREHRLPAQQRVCPRVARTIPQAVRRRPWQRSRQRAERWVAGTLSLLFNPHPRRLFH